MSRRFERAVWVLAFLAVAAAFPALAQEGEMPEMTPEQQAEIEAYMKAGTPAEPHAAMAASVGTFDLEVKSWHDPSGPPMVEKGTATRRMTLDGRVLVEEMESTMMGQPYAGVMRMGYDNVTQTYWSTWTDSMSTGLMVSEGTCDGDVCTFTGAWNDPITKGPFEVRMVTTRTGPTSERFEMYGPGDDGDEVKMMEITYRKR